MTTPIPHLPVSNGEAAITFYQKAFGATLESKMPAEDGQRLMHVALKLGGGTLMLHDEFPEYGSYGGAKAPTSLGGASCTIHLDFEDADAAFDQAVSAGASIIMPLANQFWGMRYGQVKDPFGHVWSIGGPVKPE
ncbi:MAG: VOC family protein [Pseudomonadota bacterium]